MMKTLVVITFGPVESRSNGYLVRVWNILKAFSKVGKLKVIVLEFPEQSVDEQVKAINGITFIRLRGNELSQGKISEMLRRVFTFDLIHAVKFQVFSIYELLKHRKLIARSDAVMIEGSLLLAGIVLSKPMGKKVILDTHCINKLLARRFRSINRLVYLFRVILWDLLERVSIRLSDLVIVVSNEERQFVIKEYGADPHSVLVIPNIVEPPKRVSREEIVNLRKMLNLEDKIVLMFVGDLRAVQNADAVSYIINDLAPWIWDKRKDVVFLIVGRGEEKFQCTTPNIMFTGFVEDLAPYLVMADVCIAPLRVGAGTKTKVLEYLAYGKPVITTPIGVEGLEDLVKGLNQVIIADINTFKETLLDVIEKLKSGGLKSSKWNPMTIYQRLYDDFYNSSRRVVKWICRNMTKNTGSS